MIAITIAKEPKGRQVCLYVGDDAEAALQAAAKADPAKFEVVEVFRNPDPFKRITLEAPAPIVKK